MRTEMSLGLTMLQHQLEMQRRSRAAMLGAVTPAHRDLIARLVGALAVAPEPDIDRAAAQLDAQLTPAEVRAIGQIVTAQRQASLADASQFMGALSSSITPEQRKAVEAQGRDMAQSMSRSPNVRATAANMQAEANDPGHVVLTAVLTGLQPYGKIMKATLFAAPPR